MEIRDYRDGDADAVAALAAATWPEDRFMRGQHEQHAGARCVVAVNPHGAVVGVASAARSRWHPARLELVGTADHGRRRAGLGTALLHAIRARCPGEILRVRTPATDERGLAFLSARGFAPLMRRRTLAVDPMRADVRSWCASVPVPDGYDLVTDGLDPAAVLDLCHRLYAQAHRWNPAAPMTPERARTAFFGGRDELPDPLIVARAGGELVGAAYAECDDDDTDQLFVMPSGVLGMDRPGAAAVTAAMVAYVLSWAGACGRTVIFEVDDAAEHLAAVVAALPAEMRYDLRHLELMPDHPRTVERQNPSEGRP